MLVLTRRTGEQIQIGDEVLITVIQLQNGKVRLGIKAPTSIPIIRGELQKEMIDERYGGCTVTDG